MKPFYLLDTCIVSEAVKPEPSPLVLEKLKKYEGLTAISAVVWHELLFGVNRLPGGRRKSRLEVFLRELVAPHIPVIPYDDHAAWFHASLRAQLEKEGRSLSFADGQIASTALANNMILVTRNKSDFVGIQHLYIENWFLV